MRLRWTSAAADDLENIANYLFEKTPENAARLIRELYDAPSTLKSFPNRGRAGKKEGTRELVMPSLPYIIVYQVRGDTVHIVRIQFAGLAAMNDTFDNLTASTGSLVNQKTCVRRRSPCTSRRRITR
jgi:addiction module RelE/StbE family toxin